MDDTAPEKPTDFFMERNISSASGEDGRLDTRLVSESIAVCAEVSHLDLLEMEKRGLTLKITFPHFQLVIA